jgi:hypothetical protein
MLRRLPARTMDTFDLESARPKLDSREAPAPSLDCDAPPWLLASLMHLFVRAN